ncbi:DUF58 domain-containing protein [Modestobacter sp. I12A-02628]|uniref:DUF58 domain-containing protein n=1 Tax=Goekera deserti TaxID=2497753 RepID=A0A7K3WAF1_9ACTN|nr:DUF58 domain-containing protein [Goekera deserti]MPQ97713.1 DUF58 domain-containing protein [Goekera deserti]NDI47620.1 DUF58 domain-containing protein [Goekera deserti]NDI47683.1 DUF58 domain-containing protein [Goekera deserti]NEL53431.1 DUF58 domain-containing protein [Goekera deserti]
MSTGRVRTAFSSLTLRGRCLVAGGITLFALGALLGEQALLSLAVFALVLPALSAATVLRERFRLASRRTVVPAQVPRGTDAEVLLEVTNTDRRPGGTWALSELVPGDLHAEPRFLVDRLPAGATAALRYRVHGSRRGRYALGPLRLRLVDPFGLVLRTTAGADTAPLVVVPRVRPLSPAGLDGGAGGGGAGLRRSFAVQGEDDVSTREYRHGDDLRKVHWRATARTGELMVRLEERPWRSHATLFVDTRRSAHLLGGGQVVGPPGDPAPPPDSLEWLVEAAASIGSHLAQRGATVRVVTDTGELTPTASRGGFDAGELLDRLATLGPTRTGELDLGIEALRRAGADGPVVCLLGLVGVEDAEALVRARSGPSRDVAVLVDVVSWADAGGSRGRRPLAAAARAELERQRTGAVDLLRSAGWRVATAGADESVEQVWDRVTSGPELGLRTVAS